MGGSSALVAVALPESGGWLQADAGSLSVCLDTPFPRQSFKALAKVMALGSVRVPCRNGLAPERALDGKRTVPVLLRDGSLVRWGFGGVGLYGWSMGTGSILTSVD